MYGVGTLGVWMRGGDGTRGESRMWDVLINHLRIKTRDFDVNFVEHCVKN